MLSVIIPTYNEVKLGFLEKILNAFTPFEGVEIVCVDRHSTDDTPQLALKAGAKLIRCDLNSRAARLNRGIEASQGKMILFHHPRSLIEPEGIRHLLHKQDMLTWGGFRHRFDDRHPVLSFASWYSNEVRAKGKSVLYLDHCIFTQRDLLTETPPIPEVDIFEDTALSYHLRSFAKPQLLPFYATTSAIRFRKNGYWRQSFMNQALKLGFSVGMPHEKMNRWYERGLSLNSQYDSAEFQNASHPESNDQKL